MVVNMTKSDPYCSNCGKSGHLAGACTRITASFSKKIIEKISDQGMEHLLKSGIPVGMVQITQAEYDALKSDLAVLHGKLMTGICPRCEQRRQYNTEFQRNKRASG